MALILIFTKAAPDNMADAGWGLNRRPLTGGHGPCWQFPWHPGPVWATLTGSDSSDSSQCFLRSEGGTERGRHTNTHVSVHSTETLFIRESGKKKKHKCNDSSATCLNQRQENKWPVTFSAKQQQNKKITLLWDWLCQTFLQFWWGTVSE